MRQIQAIQSAIQNYFELAYEPKNLRFEDIFHENCLVQGVWEGQFDSWTSAQYREVMYNRQSPASTQSPRDEAVLNIVKVSDQMSAVTVQVRIGKKLFIDHLVFHELNGKWLITSKSWHLAKVFGD